MQEFTTVYNILNEGYLPLMSFSIGWTSLMLMMLLFFLLGFWFSKDKSIELKELGTVLVVFLFVIVGLFSIGNSYLIQKECIDWARNGSFDVVQGKLKITYKSAKREEFSVAGVTFSTSRADGTKCGYKPLGMQDGRFVRISHREGCILKLEVVQD
jgi:hypothetical protein